MATFRFRLAKVLEWYTRQYEEEERLFHASLAVLAEARQAIAAFEAEKLSVERDVISRSLIPSRDLVALELYLLGARGREADLNARCQRAEAGVEAQRVRLLAAQRKVRLLEKLRERRAGEHAYAEARELEELAADAFFAKWAR